MTISALSLQQARLVNLEAQGLLSAPPPYSSKLDVLNAIRRIGILQIDTINVVARSAYFILFSRVGNYQTRWLDELQLKKSIVEQWAHAACLVPIEDFQYLRWFSLNGENISYLENWAEKNRIALNAVLEAVRANGPARSSDFKSPKESGGWWNRKIEKWALEYWFGHGELSVARRENFQRVYELTERFLPEWDDNNMPSMQEVYRKLVLKTIRALGVARPSWIADYYRIKKSVIPGILEELVNNGELRQISITEWEEPAFYVPEHETLLEKASAGELRANHTTLLSPFDPLICDRERARQLYDFDFTVQCYLPAEKRTYGYFPLPILHNGSLVGRLDAKAHRKEKIFEVKSIFMENSVSPTPEFAAALAGAIQKCALWHETPRVELTGCDSPQLETYLRKAINAPQ
jgi:hypothetical protein